MVDGLARALATAGHQVSAACTTVNGPTDLEVSPGQPVERNGVHIRYFASPWLRRLYFSPGLYRYLEESVESFDVVHLHSVYLFPTNAAGFVARRKGVPYVLSPHGMLIGDLIRQKSAMVKRAWIGLIERWNLAGAMVHFATEMEAVEFEKLGLPSRNRAVIPIGIDDPPDDTELDPVELPDQYIVYLGRIDWKKNVLAVVECLEHLDPEVHLVIAGRDETGSVREYLDRTGNAGLAGRVHLLGEVGFEKWSILNRAIALVLVSRSESFATVVVEAAAMGCPCVVSPEVGLSTAVAQAGSGIVSAPSGESVASAVRKIAADRDGYSARARKMSEAYRWPRLVDEYLEMYARLAG